MADTLTVIALEFLIVFSYVGYGLEPFRQFNETIKTEQIKGEQNDDKHKTIQAYNYAP